MQGKELSGYAVAALKRLEEIATAIKAGNRVLECCLTETLGATRIDTQLVILLEGKVKQ